MAGWFPWTEELDAWLAANFARLGPQACALELGQKTDLVVSVGVVDYRVKQVRQRGVVVGQSRPRTRTKHPQVKHAPATTAEGLAQTASHKGWTALDEDDVRLAVKALVQRKCNETGAPMMYAAMAVAGHALAVGRRAE